MVRVAVVGAMPPASAQGRGSQRAPGEARTCLGHTEMCGQARNKLPCFCIPPRENALMPPSLLGTWRTPPSTWYHPSCPERQDAERKDQVTPSCQEIPDSPYCPRGFFLHKKKKKKKKTVLGRALCRHLGAGWLDSVLFSERPLGSSIYRALWGSSEQ